MQIDIRVPPFAPIPEVVDFTSRCEDAGFAGVGFVDSQLLLRDVFMAMGQAAAATSRIRLMPAVTNPLTRHVSVLASAARSVGDQAPGRVEVWIGRGFSSLNIVGLPYATVRQMRETVVDLKRLLAGEWDVFPGVHSRMRHGGGSPVPVYIAASGPKALQLAGEIADGVLLSVDLTPQALEWGRRMIAEGAERAGRDPAEVEVILAVRTTIREDAEEARAWASPLCAQRLRDKPWLEEMAIDTGGLQTPLELGQLYPDLFHAEEWERAIEISSIIPQDVRALMSDAIGLIGDPQHCLRRLRELRTAGFDHIFLQVMGTYLFPEAELQIFRETIGPALADDA